VKRQAKVTLAEIRSRLAYIVEVQNDPEVAHKLEDELYYDVLRAIAEGRCEKPREAAKLTITTAEIDFPRWFA
jgi:hypothetical protein